jgi:hypothetical protein
MADILDYLDWRGDLDFKAAPFCELDNLVFSVFSYLPLDAAVAEAGARLLKMGEAAEAILGQDSVPDYLFPKSDPLFLERVKKSRRFYNVEIAAFVNHIDEAAETQFSACLFRFEKKRAYAAFRGTDKTLTGWKENFNMAFQKIPAHRAAVEWLEKAAVPAVGCHTRLLVGGHSKGGNLAVFAAATSQPRLQKRIEAIYNNDGPGFSPGFLSSKGYLNIRERILSFIPQQSIVGLIFDLDAPKTVIQSNETGVMQHNPYSWQALGTSLIVMDGITKESRFFRQAMNDWISSLSLDERRDFVDALYTLLRSTDADTVWGALSGPTALFKLLQGIGGMDKSAKKAMLDAFARLFRAAKNNLSLLK